MDLDSLTIKVERDEDGFYVGSVVEFPGCLTQGKNVYELLDRLKEAVALYLEIKNYGV
jgi:predicted RNase H-like HicB family nuclease